jgi:CRP-like cAMP-binding protein
VISLLEEDGALGRDLDPRRLEVARRSLRAVELRAGTGPWDAEPLGELVADGFGLLLLEGLVVRRVGRARRHGAELLGPGDVLRPQGDDGLFATTFRVLEPVRVAVLDRAFVRSAAPFPELSAELTQRAIERGRSVLVQMAVAHHPRVDTRLLLLLWHLAERWGRVTTRGVVLPIRLTHALLADLVAAQRPSVTQAVIALERDGLISREEGGLVLLGEPPADAEEADGETRAIAATG